MDPELLDRPPARPTIELPGLPFTLKDYTFLERIGQGGFGEVYKVHSAKFDRIFVAKVIVLTTQQQLQQVSDDSLDAEISALRRLNHPHIIRLYSQFRDGPLLFLILEYCPGGDLQQEIDQHRDGIAIGRFMEIAVPMLEALQFCHSSGIAHRDIKPSNVFFDSYGRVKLADFGLATITAGHLCNSFGGSLNYQSPELLARAPHDAFACDVWALGVTFALMIDGRLPWHCDAPATLKGRIMKGQYFLSSRVPAGLAKLIARMIVIDPVNRATCRDILEDPWLKGFALPAGLPKLSSRLVRSGNGITTSGASNLILSRAARESARQLFLPGKRRSINLSSLTSRVDPDALPPLSFLA
jgi:serine/threonine protein kinase